MKFLVAVALLMVTGLVWADDKSTSNPPADNPASSKQTPPEKPISNNTDKARKDDKLPTPGELIKKLKEAQQEENSKPKIAYFDLSRPVLEKPLDFSLFGGDAESLTLRSLIDRLHEARDDKEIKGVLITFGAESSLNFSQAQEIRKAMIELKKQGKQTFVYADSYDTDAYTVASAASKVCLLEGGEIMIPGVGLETTFYKGLFDKLGVQADYVQIGKYKGADEEYVRTNPSDELKGELTRLTQGLYDEIVQGIADNRHLDPAKVKQIIDQSIVTADEAKKDGLVDELTDEDGLRKLMGKTVGGQVNLLPDYGRPPREAVDLSNPMGLFSLLMKKPQPESDKPEIALIYAQGVIVDGSGGGGLLSDEGVGSETIRKVFREATRDDNVKAIVLRIDSPGGSALASEVMWQAVRHAADKKPVIISVGSMAASGGYYLASAGDRIFADQSAIVGSIGVVGGKFVFKGLYDKLGINTQPFTAGENAGLFSSSEPFTDHQREMVTNWMTQTYHQFTQRVMTTRTGKIKDIDKVAQGRIFVAPQAKELGLVDEIGGLDETIAYAAKRATLEPGQYDIRVLPAPKTLADLLMGNGADAAFPFKPKVQLQADNVMSAVLPQLSPTIRRQIEMLQLFQHRPVALVSPYIVTVK